MRYGGPLRRTVLQQTADVRQGHGTGWIANHVQMQNQRRVRQTTAHEAHARRGDDGGWTLDPGCVVCFCSLIAVRFCVCVVCVCSTIVWSVLVCVLVCCVLPLSIWYFRRRARRRSQYAAYYYDDRDAHYSDAPSDAHTILPAQLQPSTAYQQTWPQQQSQQPQQQHTQAPYAHSYTVPTAM